MSADCNATSGTGGGFDDSINKKKSVDDDDDDAFQRIPERLRIKVIYQDDDIIVVSKPCGLRSVPGNASTATSSMDRKRPRSPSTGNSVTTSSTTCASTAAPASASASLLPQRLTAQQAWTEAIRLLAMSNATTTTSSSSSSSSKNDGNGNENGGDVHLNVYLQRLGANNSHLASIPRKYAPFCRYIRRSHSRIFQDDDNNNNNNINIDDDSRLETLIKQLYCRVEKCQRSLLDLPEPTRNEESVMGQLKLLGLSSMENDDSRSNHDLFPVHRLDCETSGVMVVARTRTAASILSRAWREKSKIQNNSNNNNNNNNNTKDDNNNANNKKIKVHKVYHALVYDWKPWREQQQTQGIIDLALAPHPTERIKWVAIHPNNSNGNGNGNHDSNSTAAKPSLTHWKVLEDHHHHDRHGDDQSTTAAAAKSKSPSEGAASTTTITTTTSPKTSHHNVVRLELLPITGRTHQLRIHCAETGGAIIGDSLYAAAAASATTGEDGRGIKNHNSKQKHKENTSFLHLHAYQLTFPHPQNEEREMKFTVDPAW